MQCPGGARDDPVTARANLFRVVFVAPTLHPRVPMMGGLPILDDLALRIR